VSDQIAGTSLGQSVLALLYVIEAQADIWKTPGNFVLGRRTTGGCNLILPSTALSQ
jgi:hypothetical protein